MITPHFTTCGKTFRTPRSAYLHWLSSHSRYKLRGEGEQAIIEALVAIRKAETKS